MMEEEGVEKGTEARDLVGEEGVEGKGLPLADGPKAGAVNKAAEVHGGVEGSPLPKGQDGGEGEREGGRGIGGLLLRLWWRWGWRRAREDRE